MSEALFDKEDKERKAEEKEKKELEKMSITDLIVASKIIAPGTEGIGIEDTLLPRFRLLQSLSAEVQSGESKPGLIRHSSTGQEWTELEFIPINVFKSRVHFNPEDRQGAPLCRSNDAVHGVSCDCGCEALCSDCQNAKWKDRHPADCNLVYNYLVLLPEQVGVQVIPAILSMMRASTPAAQKLNASVKFAIPPRPFWFTVWRLAAVERKFKRGPAYVLDVKQMRETNATERKWAEALYQALPKRLEVEPEAEEFPTE